MRRVTNPPDVSKIDKLLEEKLAPFPRVDGDATLGPAGNRPTSIWTLAPRLHVGHLDFGSRLCWAFGQDLRRTTLDVVVEINPMKDGSFRSEGAFFRDGEKLGTGHTGVLGGGGPATGSAFAESLKGTNRYPRVASQGTWYSVFGPLWDQLAIQQLEQYVDDVARFKLGATGANWP